MGTVADDILSAERESALVQLLDDPSPVVQTALLAEFKRLGPAGRLLLEKCVSVAGEGGRKRAGEMLEALFGPDPSRLFMEFINGLHFELESGLLMVNRIEFPEFRIDFLREELDSLANRCRSLLVHPMNPVDQCKVMNRVLFHERGFRGKDERQYEPQNCCLGPVLQGKRGSATLLACIYILVAQRLGLDLEPVAVPDRLMVGCFRTDWPVYIDAFMGGRMHSLEEVYAMLQEMQVEPEMHHLAPTPIAEVLSLVCRELALSHVREQDLPRAVLFESFLHAFDRIHHQSDDG